MFASRVQLFAMPETGRIAIYYGCADSYVGLAFTTAETVISYIKEHDAAEADDRELGRR